MGVYRVKVAGRVKPILLRAKGRPEAVARIVEEAKALTAEEVEEAFDKGESVWREGDPFPDDEPVEAASE